MVVPSGGRSKPPFGAPANELIACLMSLAVATGLGTSLIASDGAMEVKEVVIGGRLWIGHESHALKAGRDLLEHRQPLANNTRARRAARR